MEDTEEKKIKCINDKKQRDCNYKCRTGNGCIYGLGFIGSAISFIGKASTFGAGVLGFLKALVWPAIMAYEVFKHLVK
jgi:hypothetical protein